MNRLALAASLLAFAGAADAGDQPVFVIALPSVEVVTFAPTGTGGPGVMPRSNGAAAPAAIEARSAPDVLAGSSAPGAEAVLYARLVEEAKARGLK